MGFIIQHSHQCCGVFGNQHSHHVFGTTVMAQLTVINGIITRKTEVMYHDIIPYITQMLHVWNIYQHLP